MKRFTLILTALILILSTIPFAYAEKAEVKTFSMMAAVDADDPDWNDYWFFEYIEEELGIKFEIIQVSAESYAEKQNLAFATGQLPDLLVGSISSSDIAMYGEQGLILPLEDYITWENTPTIKAWFEIIDGYEAALYYPDGHIYDMQGFMVIDRELPTQRYWINDTWCQEAIGKKPETLDEYYEYLKYVKENDMDGDGDTTNEIPLAGRFTTFNSVDNCYYDAILPTLFGFGLTERTLEAVDGVVQYNPAQPVFKEFLKYMNKLYTEGLLDNAYFTQTDDQYKAKIAGGIVGAFNDWAHWLNIADEAVWSQYTSNKPMISEFNDTPMWGGRDLALQRHFIITKNCDDPVSLLKLADFIMTDTYDTPEGTMFPERAEIIGEYEEYTMREVSGRLSQWRGAQLGSWDKHPEWGWTWAELEDEMGTYWAVDTVYPVDEYKTANEFWNAVMTPNCFPIPNVMLERQSTVKENALTEEVAKWNTPYLHVGWSNNIKLTAEEADEASLLQVDIEAYLDQMYGKFVIGDVDIEAEYDNYVAGLNQRGLERYLEIYQAAYDRWAQSGVAE
jgi:putative aldouronate transport system substrate-binding protein